MLADGIDVPVFLGLGVGVVIPLLTFEVLVEAFVLNKVWKLPFRALCRLTLIANVLSLLAGIPTEFLNSAIDAGILPADIPGYFARYPTATVADSFIFFIVTLAVEGLYATRWLRKRGVSISKRSTWIGMLLANFATYAVVAPLNYYASRPNDHGLHFSSNTAWAAHSAPSLVFVDSRDHYLKSMRIDGSESATLVAQPMTDYLVSSNLDVCLFRGTNNELFLWRRQYPKAEVFAKTEEQFFMDQTAFSPSGIWAAFASDKEGKILLYDTATRTTTFIPIATQNSLDAPSVAWSQHDDLFFVKHGGSSMAVKIGNDGVMSSTRLATSENAEVYPCFGRLASTRFFGGETRGVIYGEDQCGSFKAMTWPGLDSSLMITRENTGTNLPEVTVSVRPGLLHLANFWFGDVAFLEDCNECLFEANGYIYLLDVKARHLGTVTFGDRFILLTRRYRKTL
jgi:hypothetical protein